jgi:hypothetical protein
VSTVALRTETHSVRWLTAAPLWGPLLAAADPTPADLDRMQRPAILRLDSDEFMDDLATLLRDDAARLQDLEAKPVSFRRPPPGAADAYTPPIDHLKLYQPAHGHFNLVAATLVCRIPGLPDKAVDIPSQEAIGFVLRRLAGAAELGWTGKHWLRAGTPDALVAGEQLVPMFPMPYVAGERKRRLFVGLVPTSSIETFRNAGGDLSLSPQPGDRAGDPPDRRLEELETKVVGALTALKDPVVVPPLNTQEDKATYAAAEAAMRTEASRFVLLDLADFLLRNAPQLWTALLARARPPAGALRDAYDLLDKWRVDVPAASDTWLTALLAVWSERDRIWGDAPAAPAYAVRLDHTPLSPAALRDALVHALPERTAEQRKEPQPPFQAPKLDARRDTRYIVRCVYRRPCCGPLHPDVVSDPSPAFAIASFFDLDAPARPIHISLPIDTSIAGLRKAPRNVSFMISRELRAQMGRVGDAKKALKGELSSADSLDLGMICSFSLPIITICALLLLLVIVILLNLLFWWLPFFRICFPIPLKAKG